MNEQIIKNYFKKVNPLNFKDEEILEIKRLGTGESNLNFMIRTNKDTHLLRFDITNKKATEFRQEFKILKILEPLNIAQKPLYLDISKKYFKEKLMIFSYLEGTPLNKLKRNVYSSKYALLAKKIANLHNLNVHFFNRAHSFEKYRARMEKTIKQLKNDLKNIESKKNILQMIDFYHKNAGKYLKDYKPKLAFCHGDIGLCNVLFNGKDFFLIDWELSGKQDPALELSYHFFEFAYTKKEKRSFLKEYFKIRQDKTLEKRMKVTDFFVAFLIYFDILHTCFNIFNKKGHKEYLKNANFEEYWRWGEYYLGVVFNLGLFSKEFKLEIKKDLNKIYTRLK